MHAQHAGNAQHAELHWTARARYLRRQSIGAVDVGLCVRPRPDGEPADVLPPEPAAEAQVRVWDRVTDCSVKIGFG